MNRNLFKWILIAAVILGAAAYLILSETSSGKKSETEKIEVGNSKAFNIEPIEGITISAEENALDKDREFKINPVSEKEWKKMKKELAAISVEQPLFAFDMNSGQTEEELFPGVFTCQIDLKKMGIPENLYDYIHIWRYDGEQLTKYTSWVQNGKLVFRSDHNGGWMPTLAIPSAKAVAMTAGTALLIAGAGFYLYHTWVKHSATGDLYKNFFMSNDDAAMYPVWDSYGNFEIHFRFKDTEWAGKYDEYVHYNKAADKRFLELYKQAQKDYRNHKTIESLSKTKLLPQLFKDEKDCEQSKEVITLSSILVDLCEKDSLYQEYNKKKMPPPSIVEIGEFLKLSNRYLTDNQHLKPQSINLEVNLVDGKHITGDAEYRHPGIKNAYMLVNFDHMWTNGREKYVREGMAENVLIDINHELFHHREKIMKWMDLRTEETMAAYNEYHAAKYFFEKRETTSEIPRSPSDRTHYEYYGRNFNKNSTDAEVGYVYADFMDSLQIYTGRGSTFVRADSLIGRYGYFSSHKSNYMKWFNIKDEKTFDDYLKRFCMNSFPKIAEEQVKPEIVQAGKLGAHSVLVSKSSPMAKVTTEKDGLIMRDVEVDAENRKDGSFSAFVIRDKEATEDVMAFCWCKGNYTSLHTDNHYMHTETGERGYRLGYFKYPSGKYKFTVVALFQPEQIKIRKVKEDQITFIVPKAPRALTKEKLITGAVVTYKDNNGNEITRDVKTKDFGRKATWSIMGCTKPGNSFSLSMHWYYQVDDQTLYESPESEPVTWGAKGDKPKEEVVQTKEPKSNYWKQVGGNVVTKNTSIDKGESIDDEEVSSDYRSIELKAAKKGQSLDFTGMGATEERTKEKGHVYVRDIFIEGTLTYTEPPKFWIPTQQYKAKWEIDDDPYLTKVKDPFVFEAKNTSSDQAACTQSKKDKIDNGRSAVGKVNWLRAQSTTFEARFPEKDGPKSFTLTQTYSIKEREGSNLMATVTFEYYYEWIGEPEEEEKEVEIAPESGYWQLVKTEVDDSRAKRKDSSGTPENKLNPSGKHKHNGYVTGSDGQYTAFTEWWAYADWVVEKGLHHATSYRVVNTWTRDINFTVPKKRYLPGEQIVIDINHGPVSIEGDGETSVGRRLPFGSVFMYSRSVYGDYDEVNNWLKTDAYETAYQEGGPTNNTGQVTAHYTSIPLTEKMGNDYLKSFVIIEEIKSPYGDLITKYHYEWVDGKQKAKPVKEKPVSGGHWKLSMVTVNDNKATYTSSNGEQKIKISGSKGHYSVHAEYMKNGKTYCTEDREIHFDNPKSAYKPGETIKLEITNEKVKLNGKPEYSTYAHGEHYFSNRFKEDYSYDAIRNPKKVVSTTTYVVEDNVYNYSTGTIGFSVHEYVNFGMAEVHTNYLYEWAE